LRRWISTYQGVTTLLTDAVRSTTMTQGATHFPIRLSEIWVRTVLLGKQPLSELLDLAHADVFYEPMPMHPRQLHIGEGVRADRIVIHIHP
jgi:hypothetical protein